MSVALTLIIIIGWRLWWARGDWDFRRKLPSVVRREEGKVQQTYSLPRIFWRASSGKKIMGVSVRKKEHRHAGP